MGATWKIIKRDFMFFFKPGEGFLAPFKLAAGWLAWLLFAGALYYGSTKFFVFINAYFQGLPGLIDSLSLNI